MEDRLAAAGFLRQHKSSDYRGRAFGRAHIRNTPDSKKLLEFHVSRGHTLVTPFRHPMRCAQSWANRRKAVIPGDIKRPNDYCLLGCYEAFFEWAHDLGQKFVPVDVPDREDYLKAFGDSLGVEFESDWTPVHSRTPHPRELTDDEIAGIREVMQHPFFQLLYPESVDGRESSH